MRFHLMSYCLAGSVLMAQAASGQTVTVQAGDSLYSIAQTHLGNGAAWPELCAQNSELLGGDCNHLNPGMVLNLPGQSRAEPAPVVEGELTPEGIVEPIVEPVVTVDPLTDVVYDFSVLDDGVFTAPDGFTVAHQLPDGPAQLSGNVEGEEPEHAPGISLKLPEGAEEAFSGHEIVIEILARLSKPGQINVAYSTNDVGNSGWRTFDLDTTYQRLEMRYDVPELVNGGSDYLGFLPDPLNTGQVLDISFIGISVAE